MNRYVGDIFDNLKVTYESGEYLKFNVNFLKFICDLWADQVIVFVSF